MGKRTVAIILLLFILILALAVAPAVLAENSTRNITKGKIGDRVAVAAINKARTEGKLMPMVVRTIKADENFKVRPLTQAMAERMNATFQRLKGNDTRIIAEHKEKMDSFNEILPRLRACNFSTTAKNATANSTTLAACGKIRTDAINRSKEAALKNVDIVLNHLEKLKQKLESSQNIPEAELNASIAKIDALIVEVGKIKQKIQAAATKNDINQALKDLKQLIAKVKRASEVHSQGLLRAEIFGVLQRTEIVDKNLQCALNGLKASGTDTTALDQKLAQLNATMTQAKDKLKTAKDLLGSDNETQIAQGKALVIEARSLVQQAHTMLQDIRKTVKDLGGTPCQEKQEIEVEQPDSTAAGEEGK